MYLFLSKLCTSILHYTAFKAELSKFTAEATTNLEAVSKLVNDSTISLLSAISAMKSFATEEQKAEFTKLATQANIVIHALKAAGVDTSKLEDALKQTDIKVPEIETPGTGTETPGTGGGNTGGGTVTETPEEVAKKAAEAAVKALETDPTQEKIVAAQAAVDALTALDKDYNVEDFKTAIAAAQKLVEDAKAEKENIEKATNAVNALFNDPTTEPLVIKDSIVKAAIEAASTLVETLKDSEVKTALEGKITSASTQLSAALQSLKVGLSSEGHIVVIDDTKQIDDLFTFQMANVKLDGETPIAGTPEAKNLTLANVNQVLSTVITNVDSAKNVNTHLEVSPAHKHGFSIFKAATKINVDDLKKLDKNDNNAYLITVNDKSTSTKAYKILFQVIDGKVEAKFVESDIKDADFTVKADVDALFTNDSKAALKNGIQDNGSLAVEGTFEEFKTNYTFQMKSIYLNNGAPTHFVEGKAQAKDLTIEQINKAIQATINAKNFDTSKSENNYVQINYEEKYGYTILTVDTSKLSDEVFKKLDGDFNKTYNITVNKKENNLYTKTYKILLENTNNEIKGKFIDHPAKK